MGTLWTIISWCFFGLVVGALARLLVPGKQSMGILSTIILGILGAFAGGFLGSLLFGGEITLSNPAGWIGGTIGAIILLLGYIQFTKKRSV